MAKTRKTGRPWDRCAGVIRWPFHVLCRRRADKSGLCKMHRAAVERGEATRPPMRTDRTTGRAAEYE